MNKRNRKKAQIYISCIIPYILLFTYCDNNFKRIYRIKKNEVKKIHTYLGYDHNICDVQICSMPHDKSIDNDNLLIEIPYVI